VKAQIFTRFNCSEKAAAASSAWHGIVAGVPVVGPVPEVLVPVPVLVVAVEAG